MAIIGQGAFTQPATAVSQIIQVPSNLDSIEVWNVTQSASGGATTNAVYMYWQRPYLNSAGVLISMDSTGTKGVYYSANAAAMAVGLSAANAFVLYDPSMASYSGLNNGSTGVSALTAANPAVATVGSTTGLSAGNIVRFDSLAGAGQSIFDGIPFSVGYGTLTGTTFSVDYLNATGTTSGAGNWRWTAYSNLFAPGRRVITNITAAAQAVITLSMNHQFTVGQAVRLEFPGGSAAWGSYAALAADPNAVYTVVAVDTATGNGHNTITINANTSGYSSFLTQWETNGIPYTWAQVVPIGENSSIAISNNTNLLADATTNTGYLGMVLASGALLPAGIAADTVFWRAMKADFGGL